MTKCEPLVGVLWQQTLGDEFETNNSSLSKMMNIIAAGGPSYLRVESIRTN